MQQTQKNSLFDKDDLVVLKESVDVLYLLEQLGINYIKANAKEVRGPCSIHGGDNKTAFRFNMQKRSWVCFTHKCHEEYGSDILGLIMASLKCNFVQALTFLKELVGDVSGYEFSRLKKDRELARQGFIDNYSKPEKPDYVTEEILNLLKSFRSSYFLKEKNGGFKKETLDFFEVAGGFTDTYNVLRDVIPIRDVNNNLVAYSLRDVSDNNISEDYKYLLTEPFNKDKVIYNLNKARLYGTEVPLIVVEGFKSVWRFYEYGLFNTVAVMGSSVTLGQVKILKAYALKGIILMLDPDIAGEKGDEISQSLFPPAMPIHSIRMLETEGEDPADLTLEQAYKYVGSYVR